MAGHTTVYKGTALLLLSGNDGENISFDFDTNGCTVVYEAGSC